MTVHSRAVRWARAAATPPFEMTARSLPATYGSTSSRVRACVSASPATAHMVASALACASAASTPAASTPTLLRRRSEFGNERVVSAERPIASGARESTSFERRGRRAVGSVKLVEGEGRGRWAEIHGRGRYGGDDPPGKRARPLGARAAAPTSPSPPVARPTPHIPNGWTSPRALRTSRPPRPQQPGRGDERAGARCHVRRPEAFDHHVHVCEKRRVRRGVRRPWRWGAAARRLRGSCAPVGR